MDVPHIVVRVNFLFLSTLIWHSVFPHIILYSFPYPKPFLKRFYSQFSFPNSISHVILYSIPFPLAKLFQFTLFPILFFPLPTDFLNSLFPNSPFSIKFNFHPCPIPLISFSPSPIFNFQFHEHFQFFLSRTTSRLCAVPTLGGMDIIACVAHSLFYLNPYFCSLSSKALFPPSNTSHTCSLIPIEFKMPFAESFWKVFSNAPDTYSNL